MPDFAEWGGGGGISSAIADQNTIALTGLHNAQTAMAEAQLPYIGRKMQADIMNTLATAGLHTVDTSIKQEALRRTKALADEMQRLASGDQSTTAGGSTDPTDMMMGMSKNMVQASMRAGAVQDAEQWAGRYTQMQGHKNTALKQAAQAKMAENRERLQDFDEVSRRVDMIQALPLDQQIPAYNDMNRYFEAKRKEPVPWANLQWSPQTAEILKNAALTQKQKIDAQFKDERAQYLQDRTSSILDLREQKLELDKQKAENDRLRREKLDKVAGDKAATPSKDEVNAARDLIRSDYPDIKGPDLQSAAEDIAFKAKDLRTKNPGVSPAEARARAYLDVKENLDTKSSSTNILGVDIPGTASKSTVYRKTRPGASPDLAMPIPDDPSARKEGSWYINPKGVAAQWAKRPDGTYGWKARVQ